jgi:MtN3 and saliva related transmembrane protein
MIDQINFGAFGAIFTTTAFLPQAFKVIRTRDTRSLSLSMYLLMLTGTTLWTFHGVHLNDKAIIYSNIITMKIQELLKEKKRG